MKALVIGGTGPTGPFVVEGLIRRGYKVAVFHRGQHEVVLPREVEHIHGDPHFTETLEEGLGRRSFDLVVGMYGRLRHVAEVLKGRTPRFIAVGGLPYRILVDGDSSPGGVPVLISEDSPLCESEDENRFMYLMAYSERVVMKAHQEGHYVATILRYAASVYGPRQLAPREWSVIRRLLDGRRQLIVPDGGLKLERRAYAENAAKAVLLAVDKPELAAGQVYNVGDERILSVREWAQCIARAVGSQLELVSLPFALARPSRAYVGRQQHMVMDISKISTELGYRDAVAAEEALRKTAQWYLENPLERGGEFERRLGDPFDYEVEDRIVREYGAIVPGLRELGAVGFAWRHPYDHPERPTESPRS